MSREKGAFMNKGFCEKKNKECSQKCFHRYSYDRQELPCKYFVSADKGYPEYELLSDIKGERMRRQWFFCWAVAATSFILYFLYCGLVMTVILDVGAKRDLKQDAIELLIMFGKVVIPLLILSLLNTKFFGKIVAVVTKEGVYSNQFFLKWEDIFEVKFHPLWFTRIRIHESYTDVISSQGTYKVAHMPLLFLLKAKKYNANIRVRFDKWSIVVIIIIAILPFILPFIES